MSAARSKSIKAKVESFPALPATVTQVLAVTADPQSSADDLMQVVLPDQSMCATILKVANSALFGIPREVTRIERAVVVLGQEEIRNIVLGKAIFTSFPKIDHKDKDKVGLFWEHAFTCGLTAKIIAEHFRYSASEFFVAGLIHDIGKLAMLLTFPDEYPILLELSGPTYYESKQAESTQYGIAHDKVGLELAQKWLLPEPLSMAIGYHHQPESAPTQKIFPLIVQVADLLTLMYASMEKVTGEDAMKIFHDFFPEIFERWQANQLTLEPLSINQWFETLEQQREQQQGLLNLFSS